MIKDQVPSWLKEMPKVDLHRHIGGSMPLPLILELADKYGVDIGAKTEEDLRRQVVYKFTPETQADPHLKSLSSYLDCIRVCERVLRQCEPCDFEKVIYKVCEEASKENIRILELRFGPTNYLSKMKAHEVMEAALSGIKNAGKEFNMLTGLIVCGIRTDVDATRFAAELAVEYQGKGVVGFDLAGEERADTRPKIFEAPLRHVLENFVPLTIHAGENDTVASIAEALIYLNARRIGHGITMLQSTKLYEYVNETRVGIEMCVSSNIDTGRVSSYETHPIRRFFLDDQRIAVCTDNPVISDTSVTNEYMILMEHLGFRKEDIFKLCLHSMKMAFVDSITAKKEINRFYKYLSTQEYDRTKFEGVYLIPIPNDSEICTKCRLNYGRKKEEQKI